MTLSTRTLAGSALLIACLAVSAPAFADGRGGGGWHHGGHGEGWGLGAAVVGVAAAIITFPFVVAEAVLQPSPVYSPQPSRYYVQPAPTYGYSPPQVYYAQAQQQPAYPPQNAAVSLPPPPPTYSPQPSVPEAGNSWYRCSNPNGYYPYVQSCPSGWQRVPSSPPG